MIRLHHAMMEIEGHKLMVDIPWFLTREEYLEWYNELVSWVRKTYGEME